MNTGDLKPDLELDLSSPRDRIHIEDADSVTVIGRIRGGAEVFNHAATSAVTRGKYAHVVMEFQSGDTDTPGVVEVSVVIVWPGNKTQTACSLNDLQIGTC